METRIVPRFSRIWGEGRGTEAGKREDGTEIGVYLATELDAYVAMPPANTSRNL